MHYYLTILKEGRLLYTYFEDGQYKSNDMTSKAPSCLFEECRLCEDCTLRDILLLLRKHIDAFSRVLGRDCERTVIDAFSNESSNTLGQNIIYLRLFWNTVKDFYWQDDIQTEETELTGTRFPDFDALGTNGECWSIASTDPNCLLDIPVKLQSKLTIDDNTSSISKVIEFDHCEFSLGHILCGVINELNWYKRAESRAK
ncbi:MAG: hypothetical protein F6J87_16270 [Spirulina sp. SIO3F2]|nr:hypothetical protein [Spirulina sp. SIO3F2]